MSDETPKVPLGQQVREHYTEVRMDPDAKERLRWMITGGASEVAETPASARPPRRRWRHLSMAAAVLVATFGGAQLSGVGPFADPDPCGRFARLLSGQACRQLESEFEADSFLELSGKMDRLGFQLVEPGFVGEKGLAVRGGRYTSVDGELLAEVQLVHHDGRTCTLFVRRMDPPYTPETRGEYVLDGLAVSVWSEAGLLFGLTRPATEA